ncbi:MAG: phosphoribosylformylglycinamidine synthase subunit PurS, partial [Phycisphaerales bacterium]
MSTSLLRVEVRVRPGVSDPRAAATLAKARALGLEPSSAQVARVYLIEGKLKPAQKKAIAQKLLADPVTEVAFMGVEPPAGATIVEVHPLPGVMDPAGQSVREAIGALLGVETTVATGVRYDLHGVTAEDAAALAQKALANPVIHRIVTKAYVPKMLPKGGDYEFQLTQVPLRGKTDEELEALSREAHLFMSLPELRAVRDYFEAQDRDPTDIELETIAQTWSEHCVHKTLKSKVMYGPVNANGPKAAAPKLRTDGTGEFEMRGFAGGKKAVGKEGAGGTPVPPAAAATADPINWAGRPGHTLTADGSVKIDNLLKSTVAAATYELIKEGVDWTLS